MRQGRAFCRRGFGLGAHAGADNGFQTGARPTLGGARRAEICGPKEVTVPIYEYRCLDCRKRSSILLLSRTASPSPVCSHCQSPRLERLLSRFAAPKSDEARMESLADDETLAGLDEQNPADVERLMKHMGNEMGEDFGDEMAEAIDSSDENRSDLDESDGM
jgi:putative FmdB family regulatory protein